MSTFDNQSCASCKFAYKTADIKTILCRRYPPQVVSGPQPQVLFPPMLITGWCGEYQKKLELAS